MIHKLSLELSKEHPAYLWAKKQSDSVNALGHIGTHIDCYTLSPSEANYELEAVLLNCFNNMPKISDIDKINIRGKALILYTDVLNKHEYGTEEYGKANTFLSEPVLDYILSLEPKFILIDSCGIGNHGDEHIKFDKKCERKKCFVIENIFMNQTIAKSIANIKIKIETNNSSTGKPCEVYAVTK
ncbi:cyclase family protein [Ancylomarina sp. YFZ004]